MESSTPIAYLVTLRTFGTWLHGDALGSHHRLHRTYGTPPLPGRPRFVHLVVATGGAPEDLVRSLKSWLTRRLVASRGATSQYPALVEAREHCIPLDGLLSRPGGALRGTRSRRRAKRDLTN